MSRLAFAAMISLLRHINFLAEEEPQEAMEKIYVKCSGEKEKDYLDRSL